MGDPAISVVVPTFRRPDRVVRLLDALEAQTLPPGRFEVIVVDDCSGDDTLSRLEARRPRSPYCLRVLRTPSNGGPAVARNIGWRAASAPLIAFVDDDCVPEPEWLGAGLGALAADGHLGVLQGRVRIPDDVDWAAYGRWAVYRRIDGPSAHFEGCNIFYRREALAATGGFDEEIKWWGEDSAAGWKVVEAGWGRGFAGDAVVVHDVESRGFRSFLRHSYLERNLVRLAAQHPGFRAEYFWRPWAVTREDAALVAAVLSGLAAMRWRPAAAGTLPYLWLRRPSRQGPDRAKIVATNVVLDISRLAGHVVGSVKNRVFVL